MTTDGVAEDVAAVHPYLTTPPPPGTPAMTSVTSDPPGGAANTTFTDKFDSRLLWYEDYIVGFFLIVVGLVSLLGNGSSMVMFCRRLRHLTAAEVLLLNLAVMHLCLAVFSYPAPTVSSFAHRWLFGNVGCQLYGFVCYTLGIATIMSMAALAVVRYLKTCTHTYSRTITTQHMKVVLLGVYLYSLFWSLLPLLSLASSYEVEPFGTSCTLHWTSTEQAARIYILLVVVFVVVVPFLVMLWCYLEIVLLVRRNHRKKLIMAKRSGHSQGRTELKLTLVSGLVCIGFLVAWLPYTVVSVLYGLLGRESPIYLTLAPVLLAKSSCAYNPVIYVFINVRYRRQMFSILCETFRPLLCDLVPQPCENSEQPPETSQDVKLSRAAEGNQGSSVMEEVQPLTAETATTTLTASSAVDTQITPQKTPSAHSPEHPLPSQHEDGIRVPAATSSSGQVLAYTPAHDDVQNSTTVFHPLYSFPGGAAAGASEAGEAKASNGSVVDGQKPPTDGRAGDGGEVVGMVSSPTDSGVGPPDSLRDGSIRSQGREKRASEPEMEPLAETTLDKAKLSPVDMGVSPSSQLTSPGASATPSQHAEDLSPGDATLSHPRPTVLHI